MLSLSSSLQLVCLVHLFPSLVSGTSTLPSRSLNPISPAIDTAQPSCLKKGIPDPGVMFSLHDWTCSASSNVSNTSIWAEENAKPLSDPPLLVHQTNLDAKSFWSRHLLGRDFVCPAGTNSCADVNRPNLCCPSSLTCNVVNDGPLGDVACCQGSDCSGQALQCPSDYTPCEANAGGCCLPGFSCAGIGCVQISTVVVVVTPNFPQSTSTSPSSTKSVSVVSITSATSTSSPSVSSTSSTLLPISTTSLSSQVSSTTIVIPPIQPTSETTVTVSSSAPSYTVCPVNYYRCSAYYNSDSCCQIGRDCGTSSCLASSVVTELVSNGVTILVQGSSAMDTPQNNCAQGWFSCPASLNGGCCPTGYACASQSCTATASSVGQTESPMLAKENGVHTISQSIPVPWIIFQILMMFVSSIS